MKYDGPNRVKFWNVFNNLMPTGKNDDLCKAFSLPFLKTKDF